MIFSSRNQHKNYRAISSQRTNSMSVAVLLAAIVPLVSSCGNSAGGSNDPNGRTVPSYYSIGGTIIGLATPSGLVLQNNGGDDLVNFSPDPTAAPGQHVFDFTFPTLVISEGAYNVTVKQSPANQKCVVGD